MLNSVKGKPYYHINRLTHYSTYPQFFPEQSIVCGNIENPFFSYFRTHTYDLAVTQMDGSSSSIPAIKFLEMVRDGQITSNDIGRKAYEIAKHFMKLARELLWEKIRSEEFPFRPSRQRAMWLIPDQDGLERWEHVLGGDDSQQFQIAEVLATGDVHLCDARLLMSESEPLDESERKARAYWDGDMSQAGCLPEVLFVGTLEVKQILSTRPRLSMVS